MRLRELIVEYGRVGESTGGLGRVREVWGEYGRVREVWGEYGRSGERVRKSAGECGRFGVIMVGRDAHHSSLACMQSAGVGMQSAGVGMHASCRCQHACKLQVSACKPHVSACMQAAGVSMDASSRYLLVVGGSFGGSFDGLIARLVFGFTFQRDLKLRRW